MCLFSLIIYFVCFSKVGCIFPVVISSELRMGLCKDDDHREDAPNLRFDVSNRQCPTYVTYMFPNYKLLQVLNLLILFYKPNVKFPK